MSDQPIKPKAEAQEVKYLRDRTGFTWLRCKQLLETLTSAQLEDYLAMREAQRGEHYFHDPIEDDPAIRPLFLSACEEAAREVQVWHEQQIAELEKESPDVAEVFRTGRGLCHRHWATIKTIMKERHNIDWRTPVEMNPDIIFD